MCAKARVMWVVCGTAITISGLASTQKRIAAAFRSKPSLFATGISARMSHRLREIQANLDSDTLLPSLLPASLGGATAALALPALATLLVDEFHRFGFAVTGLGACLP